MNSMKIKKTLIKLLPYIIVGLVCTNLGEAWRLAEEQRYSGRTALPETETVTKKCSNAAARWQYCSGKTVNIIPAASC